MTVVYSTKEGRFWRSFIAWLGGWDKDAPSDAAYRLTVRAKLGMALNTYSSGDYLNQVEDGPIRSTR